MDITFGELWDSLKNYPRSINYYDQNKNEEDTINNYSEMRFFESEHREDVVEEFAIYASGAGFKLEVTL